MDLDSAALSKLCNTDVHSSQSKNSYIYCSQNKHSTITGQYFLIKFLGLLAYQNYQTVYWMKGKTLKYKH